VLPKVFCEPGARAESGFVIGCDALPELALPSFRAFLDLYVNEPEQLGLWDMKSKR